jgi:parallel beta-helix repeat protein
MLTLLLLAVAAQDVYHVDSETGADANPGTSPTAAWRTLARVNAAQKQLRAGDRVLFRAGQVFTGALKLETPGVTYGRFGEGASPEITGFIPVTNWKPIGSGVWEASVPSAATPLAAVSIDGTLRPMGRTPNTGFLRIDSHVGKASITDADLPASPDWTGAEVVLRKYRWVIDRSRITKHAEHTLTYAATSAYDAIDGHGYFLQNDARTLDAFGEWFFDAAAGTLRVHFGAFEPSRVKVRVSTVNTLIAAAGRQDLTFEGLTLTGANKAALLIDGAERITLRDCGIRESGFNAIQGGRVRGFRMEESTIEDTNNNGITLNDNASNIVLRRLTVRRTGMHPGMGGSGDGTYNAVVVLGGSDIVIEDYVITDTGYLPIHFAGSKVVVQRGFIQGFASVKDDAGAIYTWTGATDRTPVSDRTIADNIILDGKGAPGGAVGETKAYGIYLDDAASRVEVRGNTVIRTDAGLFLHNAHHCTITRNTFFDNAVQLLITHDDIAPEAQAEIRGITFTDNRLISRTPWQPVLSAKSTEDDFAKFGTFERNVYARPADQGMIIRHGIRDRHPQAYDLEGRQEVTGLDRSTRPAKIRIDPYTVRPTLGPNLVANGEFASDVKGVSWWSGPGNAEVVWVEGKLDGGCLHHRYKALSGKPGASLMTVPSGPLVAGGRYLLKFTVLGSAPNGSAGVRLQDGSQPWGPITELQDVKLDRTRRDVHLLFTVPVAKSASGIQWVFNEGDGTFWIDNIDLREATVVSESAGYRFEVNPTEQPKTVRLDYEYVDIEGAPMPQSLILEPWSSRVMIRKDACLPQ